MIAITVVRQAVLQLQGAARLELERQGQRGVGVEASGQLKRRAHATGAALGSTCDAHAQRAGVAQGVALQFQISVSGVGTQYTGWLMPGSSTMRSCALSMPRSSCSSPCFIASRLPP